MALEDLPFFFVRWGAHINFLRDAIPQKPSLRQNRGLVANSPVFLVTAGWRAT
jgi:hypothetical protein